MKKLLQFLTHRVVFVAILLLLQISAVAVVMWRFENYFLWFYIANLVLAVLIMLYIINSKTNPSYKIAWLVPVLTIPIFGTVFYIMFGGNKLDRRTQKKLSTIQNKKLDHLKQPEKIMEALQKEDLSIYTQLNYLLKTAKYPTYQNTEVTYFKIGEAYYETLLEELQKAKHYIFLEYFIIQPGKMWDSILEVLKEKVQKGVDVRVIYDDMGSIMTLPSKYYKTLQRYGIQCTTFNRFIPVLSSKLNNRDHRKIAVIDGNVGFTGGINLADEYINEKVKYGHWKDTGIMLKGEAVWSLTMMFLSLWDYVENIHEEYDDYKPDHYEKTKVSHAGYVTPYDDTPLDNESVGENVYLNMIYRAKKYIYIMTPYLIIDNEMMVALCTASKSGIDVRIITPGIPDKKMVNEVTKAYYNQLLHDGVKIYEYTPGFIHAKSVLVDDVYATVGTINMDFRSLYLHFENSVFLYKVPCLQDIKADFLETFEVSHMVSLKEAKRIKWLRGLKRAILRLFAPLM